MRARCVGSSWSRVPLAAALAFALAGIVDGQQPQAPPTQQPPVPPPAGLQAPPPAGAQTPAAKPAGPALNFTGDSGFVIFTVRAEGASDFEAFFGKVRDALETGTKPEYQKMAAGWTLFKVTDAPQSGQVLYAMLVDPAVKGADYDPNKIVEDVFPADAVALYSKLLRDALISVNRLNLQTAVKMNDCPLGTMLPCQKLRLNPPYTR